MVVPDARGTSPASLVRDPEVEKRSVTTHMLENGTDVTVVQQLLGHADIKTTLCYLQVTSDLKRRAIDGLT